jgi:hypothetical protein
MMALHNNALNLSKRNGCCGLFRWLASFQPRFAG